MADSRWAIEFDPQAAEAFRINHPEAQVVVNDISVLLQVGRNGTTVLGYRGTGQGMRHAMGHASVRAGGKGNS